MPATDKRIDAYIGKSAEFARPILKHLRSVVHRACPDVEETIKWGFPHFDYKGMMCSMAAFKHHCAFGFWKASLLSDRNCLFSRAGKTAMGHLGRIESRKDIPSDKILIAYIKEAAALNDAGVHSDRKSEGTKKPLALPPYFKKALAANPKAKKTFEGFSPSHKREYVEWITEAKTEPTREKRLTQAIEWMSEGKERNWKYARKR